MSAAPTELRAPVTVAWPSVELPGLPSFRLSVVDGWVARAVPGLLAVVAPAASWGGRWAGFVPTLSVAGDTVVPGALAGQLLDAAVADAAAGQPGTVRATHPEPTTCCGAATPGRRPESAQTARLHGRVGTTSTEHVATVVVVATSSQVWHAFSITSTWAPAAADDPGPALFALHSSFTLTH